MIRFFVKQENIGAGTITLCSDDIEHIRSLRLRPDEHFIVCDENAVEYICKLCTTKSENGDSYASILDKRKSQAEPSVNCTIFMAYAKGDRLDYAVQKCVELGAYQIVLFESARCIAVPKNIPQKLERLQKIALEAAKQSGRGTVPAVTAVKDFRSALNEACKEELTMLCYEGEANLHIRTVFKHFFPKDIFLGETRGKVKTAAIITGPEGGFEPSEVALAQSKSVSVATMGPRILRSETAPVAALTALMYHTGNL